MLHPSKVYHFYYCLIATPGKAVFLLKAKAIKKKKYTPPVKFEANLEQIMLKRYRVRRLVREDSNQPNSTQRQRDIQMETEEEKDNTEENKE